MGKKKNKKKGTYDYAVSQEILDQIFEAAVSSGSEEEESKEMFPKEARAKYGKRFDEPMSPMRRERGETMLDISNQIMSSMQAVKDHRAKSSENKLKAANKFTTSRPQVEIDEDDDETFDPIDPRKYAKFYEPDESDDELEDLSGFETDEEDDEDEDLSEGFPSVEHELFHMESEPSSNVREIFDGFDALDPVEMSVERPNPQKRVVVDQKMKAEKKQAKPDKEPVMRTNPMANTKYLKAPEGTTPSFFKISEDLTMNVLYAKGICQLHIFDGITGVQMTPGLIQNVSDGEWFDFEAIDESIVDAEQEIRGKSVNIEDLDYVPDYVVEEYQKLFMDKITTCMHPCAIFTIDDFYKKVLGKFAVISDRNYRFLQITVDEQVYVMCYYFNNGFTQILDALVEDCANELTSNEKFMGEFDIKDEEKMKYAKICGYIFLMHNIEDNINYPFVNLSQAPGYFQQVYNTKGYNNQEKLLNLMELDYSNKVHPEDISFEELRAYKDSYKLDDYLEMDSAIIMSMEDYVNDDEEDSDEMEPEMEDDDEDENELFSEEVRQVNREETPAEASFRERMMEYLSKQPSMEVNMSDRWMPLTLKDSNQRFESNQPSMAVNMAEASEAEEDEDEEESGLVEEGAEDEYVDEAEAERAQRIKDLAAFMKGFGEYPDVDEDEDDEDDDEDENEEDENDVEFVDESLIGSFEVNRPTPPQPRAVMTITNESTTKVEIEHRPDAVVDEPYVDAEPDESEAPDTNYPEQPEVGSDIMKQALEGLNIPIVRKK